MEVCNNTSFNSSLYPDYVDDEDSNRTPQAPGDLPYQDVGFLHAFIYVLAMLAFAFVIFAWYVRLRLCYLFLCWYVRQDSIEILSYRPTVPEPEVLAQETSQEASRQERGLFQDIPLDYRSEENVYTPPPRKGQGDSVVQERALPGTMVLPETTGRSLFQDIPLDFSAEDNVYTPPPRKGQGDSVVQERTFPGTMVLPEVTGGRSLFQDTPLDFSEEDNVYTPPPRKGQKDSVVQERALPGTMVLPEVTGGRSLFQDTPLDFSAEDNVYTPPPRKGQGDSVVQERALPGTMVLPETTGRGSLFQDIPLDFSAEDNGYTSPPCKAQGDSVVQERELPGTTVLGGNHVFFQKSGPVVDMSTVPDDEEDHDQAIRTGPSLPPVPSIAGRGIISSDQDSSNLGLSEL